MIVFPELVTLPGAKTERLCRDDLALSDQSTKMNGVPQFEPAARTFLSVSSSVAAAIELMKHRRSDVGGRAIPYCLGRSNEAWSRQALSIGALQALAYTLPETD